MKNFYQILLITLACFLITTATSATIRLIQGDQIATSTLYISSDDVVEGGTNYFDDDGTDDDVPEIGDFGALAYAHSLERHFIINVATTSVDYKGTNFDAGATSTLKFTAPEAMTITWLGGDVQTSGTCGMQVGDGTNKTPYQSITTSAATSTPASSNTFTALENWQFEIYLSTDDTVCTIIGEYNTD